MIEITIKNEEQFKRIILQTAQENSNVELVIDKEEEVEWNRLKTTIYLVDHSKQRTLTLIKEIYSEEEERELRELEKASDEAYRDVNYLLYSSTKEEVEQLEKKAEIKHQEYSSGKRIYKELLLRKQEEFISEIQNICEIQCIFGTLDFKQNYIEYNGY